MRNKLPDNGFISTAPFRYDTVSYLKTKIIIFRDPQKNPNYFMLFPSHEYQILYRDLLLTFVQRFHKGNLNGLEITSRKLWSDADKKAFYKDFFNGKSNVVVPDYYYRRHIDLNPNRCFQGDIHEEALSSALRYIGFGFNNGRRLYSENLPHQILAFRTKYKDEIRRAKLTQRTLFQNWYSNLLESDGLGDGILVADQTHNEHDRNAPVKDYEFFRAKELSERYTAKLNGTKWWLYFHDNDPFRIISQQKDAWVLAKLVLSFEENKGKLEVKINNTKTHTHYDYVGSVDFSDSSNFILVIRCKTTPYSKRSVEIRFNFDDIEVDGALLFGQYINEEEDGHIISGSMIFENILTNAPKKQHLTTGVESGKEHNADGFAEETAGNERKTVSEELLPHVYIIPKIKQPSTEYSQDIDGIDKGILTYLHDANLNFRRTPLKVRFSKKTLQEWFDSRRDLK